MAIFIFKKDQPIQSLSGTCGDLTFRTLPSGRTVGHIHELTSLIDVCVASIQDKMSNIPEAIRQRRAIKKRVTRLHNKLRPTTDDDAELRKRILMAYYQSRRKLPSRSKTPKRTLFTGANPCFNLRKPRFSPCFY